MKAEYKAGRNADVRVRCRMAKFTASDEQDERLLSVLAYTLCPINAEGMKRHQALIDLLLPPATNERKDGEA